MSDSLRPRGLQHARLPCSSPIISWSWLKLMSVELVMPSNHLILCRPLLLLPSIFPSIRVFSKRQEGVQKLFLYWSIACPEILFIRNISKPVETEPGRAPCGGLRRLSGHVGTQASLHSICWSKIFRLNSISMTEVGLNKGEVKGEVWEFLRMA